MAYSSNLTSPAKIQATLRIDGIPILFGSVEGLTMAAVNTVDASWPALTSVDALIAGSLKLEGTKLDMGTLMVPPAGASLSIGINATWNKYFERRRMPQPRLTAQCTVASGTPTLTVSNSAGIEEGEPVYINRETLLVDTVPTSRTIAISKRNWCSLPGNKRAAHNTDAVLSTVPRHLLGRMAELRFWSSSLESDSEVVRYLIISDSPRYNLQTGAWDIAFTDAMSFFGRKIAVGFKGAAPTSAIQTTYSTGVNSQMLTAFSFSTEDAPEFATNANAEGALMLKTKEGGKVLPIIVNAGGQVGVASDPAIGLEFVVSGAQINPTTPLTTLAGGIEARRCYVFEGQPLKAAMQLMLSDAGQLENHGTYDVLFGLTSSASAASYRITDGRNEKRFGAAIPAAMVTVPTEVDMVVPGFRMVVGANGEEDLLERLMDCAYAAGGFWVFTDSMRFVSFDGVYTDSTLTTISVDAGVAQDTQAISVDDESSVIHTVTIKCNHNPVANVFTGIISASYTDERETFREVAGTVTIERKGLVCNLPIVGLTSDVGSDVQSRAGFEDVRVSLDRLFYRFAKGTRRYKMELPWQFSRLRPSDLLRVTYEFFNAFDATTVTALPCMVTSATPSFERGTVDVEMEVLHTGKLFAPTGEVTGWAGAVATMDAASKFGGGATPTNQFAIGWTVDVYRAAAVPPFSTKVTKTISSMTGTTITLNSAPASPGVGDRITLTAYDSAGSSTANALGLTPLDYAFMADSDGLLGSADAEGDTWT